MALRASLPCLGFTKWGFGRGTARHMLQPSVGGEGSWGDVSRQMSLIKRIARQQGTLNRVFQIHKREFPKDRRRFNQINRAYFRRWHYLKYCTQVIRYSINKQLRFRTLAEEEAVYTQHEVFEGVPPSLLGSGRLTHALVQQRQAAPVDTGFSEDELRNLATSWRSSDRR
eukprot:TRINITY_DN32978_c0_g1_i1.p1 TRINITY_DN32978_c0_g1~~TRINITY_DN32978_c0_g1_i1.p1  ORF type:complete len:190 (+),score=30.30 TRINITY_DN32978_c0_g1_i1:63-572(+)